MQKPCDLKININDEEIFLLNKEVMSKYSGKIESQIQNKNKNKMMIEMNDFPCGPNGFELVSMFCYNNGKIPITVSNVLILHCSALYLDMTEEFFTNNLIQQTENFLDRIYHWTWNDTLLSLKSCVSFHSYAENCGILDKIMFALLAKIALNSDPSLLLLSPSSSPSSPENNNKRLSFQTTPKTIRQSFPSKAWWFQDMDSLPPMIIDKFLRCIGGYKKHNNNLVLTRFLIDYLKKSVPPSRSKNGEYSSIAETAAYGVIFVGKNTFSCRTLFWVLRIVSCFGLSEGCRMEMEKLIGGNLEEARLDDLLVCGNHMGLYYDVNFVIRLVKLFVESNNNNNSESLEKMRKVGRLIDKYLREVSADQNLKISKFLGVAECLPDSARDCFDGLYRAIDIYLQSHPMITFEERSRFCRCLNYNKLSFEICKDLAKNPKIPPRIAMQALISQKAKIPQRVFAVNEKGIMDHSQIILYNESNTNNLFLEEKEDMRLNLESMQLRVRELEKLCNQMKNQMSRFGVNNSNNNNGLLSPSCAGNGHRFC
ncbi:BTB/POZ domain-containing protein At1g50280-like [Arachis stenosperma]|uniref:BTB/POZ domain-containing protein At1g50280-like n=1 Tax=Arachis stenosperma TaxID=217475 RepID=UPI0025ABB4DF|nr:BTB/POZ domain-containing protein At1g50280-like [Arachis stenosperma]